MGMWLDILVDGMGQAVSWLQAVEVFDGVSIWSFILTVLIMSIIITSLVNVVKASFSNRRSRERKEGGE